MKVERLKRRKEFSQTFKAGHTFSNRLLVLFVQESDPQESSRVGFTTARTSGKAVRRNRIRRRLRAAFAEFQCRVRPGRRVVILGKAPVYGAEWDELCRSLGGLLARSGVLEAKP